MKIMRGLPVHQRNDALQSVIFALGIKHVGFGIVPTYSHIFSCVSELWVLEQDILKVIAIRVFSRMPVGCPPPILEYPNSQYLPESPRAFLFKIPF
jgi:hypothetical protein